MDDGPSADGAGPAVEAAMPITPDGAADTAAGDLLSPEVAAAAPDVVLDSPVGALPDAGIPQPDGAIDDQTPVAPPSDGGTDSGALDLAVALPGKTLTYWASAQQRRPDGGLLSRRPTDQDYETITPVAKYVVEFFADGSTVQMTAIPPRAIPLVGTRTSTDQEKWTYSCTPPPGGEFVVWISGTTISASEIMYGSGVPVTESTRGELRGD